MANELLANIVNIIHKIVVMIVVGTPFVGGIPMLLINLVFMFGIMFHWAMNSNICVLTVLEKSLRGIPYDGETFFGQLFGKIYYISNDSYLYWLGITFLVGVTFFRLLSSLLDKKQSHSH